MAFENNSLKDSVEKCLLCITCEEILTKQDKRCLTKLLLYVFNRSNQCAHMIVSDDIQRKQASAIFFEFIMSSVNSDKMKTLAEKLDNIDVEHIVKITIDKILTNMASKSPPPGHIHWAPTQSGKSAFKDLVIYVGLSLNVSIILMTKGVGESKELTRKLASYLPGSSGSDRIFSPYLNNLNDIETEFIERPDRACVLVIPDTEKQIEYARWLQIERLQHVGKKEYLLRHMWIFDEGDALTNRSVLETQKNEVEIIKAMELLKPYVVNVTATPVPLFRKAQDRGERPTITTLVKKTDNYVGLENFRHFTINPVSMKEGFSFPKFKPKYKFNDPKKTKSLAKNDRVMSRNKFPDIVNRKNPKIPKLDEYSMLIIRKELRKKKGQLTLINTCSRVNTGENIFDQAAAVQDYFYTVSKKELIAIVVHADKVFYRLPGHKYGVECKMTLSNLIDTIDNHSEYGLKMPVIVFGYFSMKRSRSFRSSNRVATSMIMCTGKGQSNENICQIAGRLTGKGKDVLRKNRMTDQVLLVCPLDDYTTIMKHDGFVTEIINLYHQGMSWNDVFKIVESSKNNYLHESKRKTGNIANHQNAKSLVILSATEAVGVAVIDLVNERESDVKEEVLDHNPSYSITGSYGNSNSSSISATNNYNSSSTSSAVIHAANTKTPNSLVAWSKEVITNNNQSSKWSIHSPLFVTKRTPSLTERSMLVASSRKRKSPWRRKKQNVIDLSADDDNDDHSVIDLSADDDNDDSDSRSKTE